MAKGENAAISPTHHRLEHVGHGPRADLGLREGHRVRPPPCLLPLPSHHTWTVSPRGGREVTRTKDTEISTWTHNTHGPDTDTHIRSVSRQTQLTGTQCAHTEVTLPLWPHQAHSTPHA